MSILELIIGVQKMFSGKIEQLGAYSSFKSDNLVISSEQDNFLFHTDGEAHIAEKMVTIQMFPKSLNVITV